MNEVLRWLEHPYHLPWRPFPPLPAVPTTILEVLMVVLACVLAYRLGRRARARSLRRRGVGDQP
jgi:hypothetical protein